MDITIRPCEPGDLQSWATFLDRNFGYKPPERYIIDFAPLFTPEALFRSRLALKGGAIVSSATFFPVTAVTPAKKITLAIVGAVATDERYRGQGHSKGVLEQIEAAARDSGVDGLILWSDQHEFYARLGYSRVGHQQIFSLSSLQQPEEHAPGEAVYHWDLEQVRRLYERHPMRLERSSSYWQAISRISSCKRAQWVDDEGKVQAYLAYDRGHDLQGIVHEWGGDSDSLLSLLARILRDHPGLQWLTHPRMPDPVSPMLGEPMVTGTLALFKPFGKAVTVADLEDVWFWGLDSL